MLVLASTSPRRQQLLADAGLAFLVDAPDVEEWNAASHPELSPAELARFNAGRKAQEVSLRFPEAIVLGADTVVTCEGKVLGKPADLPEAHRMLEWLSGKTHEVITGISFVRRSERVCTESIVRSWVTFRVLDQMGIEAYLEKVHVLDKAGGYALQEYGDMIVERFEGSKTNIIGLPMETVLKYLHNHP